MPIIDGILAACLTIQELSSQLPPLSDLDRFPPRWMVAESRAFNSRFCECLRNRRDTEVFRWWEMQRAIDECNEIWQAYDALDDAHCQHWNEWTRRGFLSKLRELIGEEAYYAARLPPVVPVWCLRRAD